MGISMTAELFYLIDMNILLLIFYQV